MSVWGHTWLCSSLFPGFIPTASHQSPKMSAIDSYKLLQNYPVTILQVFYYYSGFIDEES